MRTLTTILFLAAFTAAASVSAQVKIIRTDTSGTRMVKIEGDVFHLPEIGALITAAGDTLHVVHVMPADRRPKGYSDVDVQQGDRVLMLNGKHVTSPKELERFYKGLPVGDQVKLGLSRNGNLLIASFAKADPKDLPKTRTIIKKRP